MRALIFFTLVFHTHLLYASAFQVDTIIDFLRSSGKQGFHTNTHNDFEGEELTENWNFDRIPDDHSFQISDEISRRGSQSARIELRTEDRWKNSKRAEIKHNFHSLLETMTWYSFSIYFPEDLSAFDNRHCVVAQWHDQDSSFSPIDPVYVNNPPLAVRIDGSKNTLSVKSKLTITEPTIELVEQQKLYKGPIPTGWVDFVFKIKWSATNGTQEMWVREQGQSNYRKVISYEGPTWLNPTLQKGRNTGVYLKLGLYCPKRGPEHALPHDPLVLFFDSISVGHSSDAVCIDQSPGACPGLY